MKTIALRRCALALLVALAPLLAVTSASAATYPPAPPTHQSVRPGGLVYGGSTHGARVIEICGTSGSASVAQGVAFVIRVCGFLPGSSPSVTAKPPTSARYSLGQVVVDGDGKAVSGTIRLTGGGGYVFSFTGVSGNLNGLSGGGGVGSRGMSRVFAEPRTVSVTINAPTAGTLPHTGGDGGGHSVAAWGGALVLLGALVVAGVARRRRVSPTSA